MKKRWKIFWIVCGICFLVGIICCGVAWGIGTTLDDIIHGFPEEMKWGSKVTKYIVTDKWDQDDDDWDNDDWDNDDWDDDDWDDDDRYDEQDDWDDDDERRDNMNGIANILENNGKASYKDINSIKSNVYTGSIHLKKGTDTDVITVESIDINEKLGFRAFEKDGILYLTSNKKIKKSNNIGKGTITVTIPENMAFNEIELNMKAGKLKADQIRTKNLEVNAGAGEVNILEFQAEEAEFVCGAGSVTASGDAGKKLEADCGVGELLLNLKGVKEDYNYDLECGIGEIRCADESYSGFGKDYTIDNHAAKNMEIECGIGQITVKYMNQM